MDGYCRYDFIILKFGNLFSVEIDSGMYPEMQEFRKREDLIKEKEKCEYSGFGPGYSRFLFFFHRFIRDTKGI